jgi:hypothetical protein
VQNDVPRVPEDADELERDVARAREQFSDSLSRASDHGEEVVKETLTKAKPVLLIAGALTAVVVAGVVISRLLRPKPLRIPVPQFVAPPAAPSPAAAVVRSLLVSVATFAARRLTERFLHDTRDTMPRLGTGSI